MGFLGLTLHRGDFSAWAQLFFDNLSTSVAIGSALLSLVSSPGTDPDAVSRMNDIVWGGMMPGLALTLVFGNIFYAGLAIHMSRKLQRDYTAQPYGINTPASFAFVYSIFYSVFFNSLNQGMSTLDAVNKAYAITLAANFITGIIMIVGGFFGPQIIKYVPTAALLIPLAAIGVAFLGLQSITPNFGAPMVGFLPLMFVFFGWYCRVVVGWGAFKVPEALQVIIIGMALGWACGYNQGSQLSDAAQYIKWWGPSWTGTIMFSNFGDITSYLGTVLPVSLSAISTSMMCLVSAKGAGDPYPIRLAMIADGFGTLFVSFFGSPFPMCQYIGHPAYKKQGAGTAYSLMNCVCFLIFGWFGLLAALKALVNPMTTGPIIFFVALMINEEALNFLPPRHYASYILGIFPSICDWLGNVGSPPQTPGTDWMGIMALKNGSMLICLLWVAMLVMMIDRSWWKASIWSAVAAILAAFGMIHQQEAGVSRFSSNLGKYFDETGAALMPGNLSYLIGYLMILAVFVACEFAQRASWLEEPYVDTTPNLLDNWYGESGTTEADLEESTHSFRIGGGGASEEISYREETLKSFSKMSNSSASFSNVNMKSP